MQVQQTKQGVLLETARYTAWLLIEQHPAVRIFRAGESLFKLPVACGLLKYAPGDGERPFEPLSGVQVERMELGGEGQFKLVASAASGMWSGRRFEWRFFEDRIEFQQHARGKDRLGKCYFFANGAPEGWGDSDYPGVEQHATIDPAQCFAPRANHANQFYHSISMPQSLGIYNEMPLANSFERSLGGAFLPEQIQRLFCPPPLALAFGQGHTWASVGLGEKPGLYLFNALDYSGARYAGASFQVNYNGYRSLDGEFASPVMAIHFGYSEYETLEQYIGWCDRSGFSTRRPYPNAAWHRQPIFCGWAEQTVQSKQTGLPAGDLCTQANYEQWIAEVEQRGIPFGTLVIDDKWQEDYGTFRVDAQKWPDMPGFIARQHDQGRRVLLWVAGHHPEGLSDAWCVLVDGKVAGADVTNPEYEAFLRRQIRHLMLEVGADGFKEDWMAGQPGDPDAVMHSPLYGIEFLRRFQKILYDEAHRCKPDALVETQTPHPLFRESADVLRLNDLHFGTRNVVEMMKARARIARLAGWPLVDCDNASSTNLQQWWDYMQVQPRLGIPALYCVHKTESTLEEIPDYMWAGLAALWQQYRRDHGLD